MKAVKAILAVAIPLSLLASPALAQEEEDEVTIDVVTEEEGAPDQVTSEIELPETASDEARENAAQGLDRANSAREKRREFGQERADEAREARGRPDGAGETGDSGPDDVPNGRP